MKVSEYFKINKVKEFIGLCAINKDKSNMDINELWKMVEASYNLGFITWDDRDYLFNLLCIIEDEEINNEK